MFEHLLCIEYSEYEIAVSIEHRVNRRISLSLYSPLFQYFLVVLILLLLEFSCCLLVTMWPQCLGLTLDETLMVKVLQGSYGVPGKEQLTAAIDMAQTKFECCAINSNINYDTSLWRLQGYGQRDWPVPQTCCYLTNRLDANAYLDPKPVNLSSCQSLQRHVYAQARHTDGCLEKLDDWYREHYAILLAASLLVAIVEFGVLLSIILSCTRLPKKQSKVGSRSTGTSMQGGKLDGASDAGAIKKRHPITQQATENIYMDSIISEQSALGSALPNGSIKEVYVQPSDAYKSRNYAPGKYQYQISKSYLVWLMTCIFSMAILDFYLRFLCVQFNSWFISILIVFFLVTMVFFLFCLLK